MQHAAGDPSAALIATSQRLNLITSDLQEGVMKTRMQPIRNVWSKFPRVVRDLTAACGKRATLVMEGEDTELDRTILEAIKDPLTHMVRNSVDHGIESVADRIAAGKPAEGTLRLRAYHEGGQVNLELSDDGRGIDIERVKEKAVERGLLTREKASRMSEREAQQLIFLPGFSTAQKVTNVSGRGVGMDVVRTNIEKIGGQVDIQSVFGAGTTLRIKIPLTLAIIPALLVTVDGRR
jgi:two-component system chemotaxis sensor kinase CheA